MPYYALTDSDWPFDDKDEGRAIIVHADSPEEAVKLATDELRQEDHHFKHGGAGGIAWNVARLHLEGFQGVTWEEFDTPTFDEYVKFSDGINGI